MHRLLLRAHHASSRSLASALLVAVVFPLCALGAPSTFSTLDSRGLKKLNKKILATDRDHVLVTSMFVGTPPQQFACVLDVSTADFWIPSKRCETCVSDGARNFYEYRNSSTFKPMLVQKEDGYSVPVRMTFKYDDEKFGGYVVNDSINLGGITVVNQPFLLVEVSKPDPDTPEQRVWDGVCGLGWGSATGSVRRPFYEGLIEANQDPVVVLIPPQPDSESGQIAIGEVPLSTAEQSKLQWTSASADTEQWVAQATSVALNSKGSPLASWSYATTSANLIVDTGTKFIMAPVKVYEEFIAQMDAALIGSEQGKLGDLCTDAPDAQTESESGVLICDCSIVAKILPSLQLSISFVLDGQTQPLNISLDQLFDWVDTETAPGQADTPRCKFLLRPLQGSYMDSVFSSSPQRPFDKHAMQGHASSSGGDEPQAPPYVEPRPDIKDTDVVAEEIGIVPLNQHILCKFVVAIKKDESVELLSATAFDVNGEAADSKFSEKCTDKFNNEIAAEEEEDEEEEEEEEGDDEVEEERRRKRRRMTGASGADSLWRIGDGFLRQFVTVLDFKEGRIGFLPMKEYSSFAPQTEDEQPSFSGRLLLGLSLIACVMAPLAVLALTKTSLGDTPRQIRPGRRGASRMQTIAEADEEEDPFAAE